jgi:hypothetical protein
VPTAISWRRGLAWLVAGLVIATTAGRTITGLRRSSN